jgi:hypothetical protein
MMKAIKIIVGILIVLVIAVSGVLFFGLTKINEIVEEAIETVGSDTLQAAVNVDAVDIILLEGRGSVKGFSIANPTGFSNNNIISVGDVGLQIDIGSITKDVKVIKEVYIDSIALRAEQKNITDTNIQALINNLKSSSNASTKQATSADKKSADSDVRLMIESLRIGDSSIDLETEKFGGRTISLPGYTQNNIGDKTTGLTPEQISQAIMDSVLTRAKQSVKKELEGLLKSELAAKAKEKLAAKVEEVRQEAAAKLQEKLGDKVNASDMDKLKGLFK